MKIQFHPLSKMISQRVPSPKSAKVYTPDWFKQIETFPFGKKYSNGKLLNKTAKLCMPFSDTFTTGYIQETWCEIAISRSGESFSYDYTMEPTIMRHRDATTPISPEYINTEFTWCQPYGIQVPRGWSILITHPLNQHQLPFHTLSGIVDADSFHYSQFPNSLPFYLRQDFEGIIPAGTPMFQIIPFKREMWTSEIVRHDENKIEGGIAQIYKHFQGGYKNHHWNRKQYK